MISARVGGLLAGLIFIMPATGFAQTFESGTKPSPAADTREWETGGFGYLLTGLHIASHGEVSSALQSAGLPSAPSVHGRFGIGGHVRIGGRWLLGGEGHLFGAFSSEETELYSLRTSGAYGFLDGGYVLFETSTLSLSPLVGFGAGFVNYALLERAEIGFDDLLQQPNRGAVFETGGFMGHAALSLEYLIPRSVYDRGVAGWLIGLRVGYVVAPFNQGWILVNRVPLEGGPNQRINGLYISLVIGVGGLEHEVP